MVFLFLPILVCIPLITIPILVSCFETSINRL
uniref:Uncharacterized protein n=1 Tax=Arundo donax TaxID=35708 RepID=A0A0A9GKU0_ARUDO